MKEKLIIIVGTVFAVMCLPFIIYLFLGFLDWLASDPLNIFKAVI